MGDGTERADEGGGIGKAGLEAGVQQGEAFCDQGLAAGHPALEQIIPYAGMEILLEEAG